MRQGARGALATGALVLGAAAYLVVYRAGPLQALGPLRNLAATLLASLPYGVAVWAALRSPAGDIHRRWELPLLLTGTVLLRLCLPLDQLVGTDDAFRYLWDGRVLAHGINPYLYAPDAPQLAPLRDALFHPNIFRPEMRTVYPPLAELWFWVAYRLTPDGMSGLKAVLLAHEVAAALILWRLLRRRGSSPLQAVVYAWSPLPVVQLFGGAHLDGLLVPWLLLAVLLTEERRAPLAAGAALGAAISVRPVAALCVPALVLRRPLCEGLTAGAGALGLPLVLLAPFAAAGRGLWESLLVYAERWRFNGSLFPGVELLAGRGTAARLASYGLVGVLSVGSGLMPLSLAARALLALGAYFALAPTLYPWYLVPMVALGTLYPRPPVLVLPAAAGLSDLVFVNQLTHGRWELPPLVLLLEYGAIYGLLLRELVRQRAVPASVGAWFKKTRQGR